MVDIRAIMEPLGRRFGLVLFLIGALSFAACAGATISTPTDVPQPVSSSVDLGNPTPTPAVTVTPAILPDASSILSISPTEERCLNQGFSDSRGTNYEQILKELDDVIWLNPRSAEAYRSHGEVYLWLGEPANAIPDFDVAIELDPLNPGSYNGRGVAYLVLDQFERAISDFDEAVRLDRAYQHAYENRGLAYYGELYL